MEAYRIENEVLPIRHIVAIQDLTISALIECFVTETTDIRNNFRFYLTDFCSNKNFLKESQISTSVVNYSEKTILVQVAKKKKLGDEIANCCVCSYTKHW